MNNQKSVQTPDNVQLQVRGTWQRAEKVKTVGSSNLYISYSSWTAVPYVSTTRIDILRCRQFDIATSIFLY